VATIGLHDRKNVGKPSALKLSDAPVWFIKTRSAPCGVRLLKIPLAAKIKRFNAVFFVRRRSFDAVLLDLTVSGGMGGIEAAERLKELDPSLKLIVSSGYSDAAVMSAFRQYGFDDVIPKPWEVAQMSEVLRRVLVPEPDRNANLHAKSESAGPPGSSRRPAGGLAV